MNQSEKNVVKLFSELIRLQKIENEYKKQKKLKSDRNKRYYKKHRDQILKRNKEMRDLYKSIKQNSF